MRLSLWLSSYLYESGVRVGVVLCSGKTQRMPGLWSRAEHRTGLPACGPCAWVYQPRVGFGEDVASCGVRWCLWPGWNLEVIFPQLWVGSVVAVVRDVGNLWVWPEFVQVANVNRAIPTPDHPSLSPLIFYPSWLNFLLGNLPLSSSRLAWKLSLGHISQKAREQLPLGYL